MTHVPGRRLADAERLRRRDGGDTLVRLQHQPHTREPRPQGQFRRVQGRSRCACELKPVSAVGALEESGPCSLAALSAA